MVKVVLEVLELAAELAQLEAVGIVAFQRSACLAGVEAFAGLANPDLGDLGLLMLLVLELVALVLGVLGLGLLLHLELQDEVQTGRQTGNQGTAAAAEAPDEVTGHRWRRTGCTREGEATGGAGHLHHLNT